MSLTCFLMIQGAKYTGELLPPSSTPKGLADNHMQPRMFSDAEWEMARREFRKVVGPNYD